jgi:SagB-type dehydrogenase family enzyme
MRVKVAECAALGWDSGKLVWDDYLRKQQFALTDDSMQVLRWFAGWRELNSIHALSERHHAIAERLVEAGVLIAEGSPEHHVEKQVLAAWGTWGLSARHYHFASRTLAGTRPRPLAEDIDGMREKARHDPPPQPFKTYDICPFTPIQDGRPDDRSWLHGALLDALLNRRSTRDFSSKDITIEELGTILRTAAGIVDVKNDALLGTHLFKTSPSAGARTPIEVYVYARRVSGLAPGIHHFAPTRGGLEQLRGSCCEDELLEGLGEQPWLVEAAALILYTAIIERTQWRYETQRSYRDILIELGHVDQTALLTATAMGLGAVFATAVCDEKLEQLLGCDPTRELVLGVTALGHKARPVQRQTL